MKIKLDLSPDKITVAQFVGFTMHEGDIVNAVQSVTGMKRSDVLLLTPSQLTEIKDAFEVALQTIPSKHVPRWKNYGFVPDINSISFGEWLDLDLNCNDFPKNLNKLLAILFRPIKSEIGKRYAIEDYDANIHLKNADEFNDMPLMIANGAMVFFSSIEKELLIHFQESSQLEMMNQMKIAIQTMEEALQQAN
jgi:hypothetical protein